MSTVSGIRTRCQGCNTLGRYRPLELMLHVPSTTGPYWQWISRWLCPPCRGAQVDYWFGSSRREPQRAARVAN